MAKTWLPVSCTRRLYQEDIEIFSTILSLNTIEYKGRIIKINPDSTEEETKKKFDKQTIEFGIDAAEGLMNLAVLPFIFFFIQAKKPAAKHS